MAAAKEAPSLTHGKCEFCPETWDPGTDVRGWNYNRKTKTWNVCPSCNRYKKHIAEAFANDRKRYWSWFSCRCGAFTNELWQWRKHSSECPSAGRGEFLRREPT